MRSLLATGLIATSLFATTPGSAREWTVDPAASSLNVQYLQSGKAQQATFRTFAAKIDFDPAAPQNAAIEVVVDLASFTSDDATATAQVASPDFFDTATHPTATYRTTSLEPLGGDRYAVTATLDLKGVTKQLGHEAVIKVDGNTASAEGTVSLLRLDWGLGAGQFADDKTVGLEVEVTFAVKASGS